MTLEAHAEGIQSALESIVNYLEELRAHQVCSIEARKMREAGFTPADEKLAAQLFGEHVELKHMEHAILLACARRYAALLNRTVVGVVSGLSYFSPATKEVRSLQTSEGCWQYLAAVLRGSYLPGAVAGISYGM
jgi:hypothetical protein